MDGDLPFGGPILEAEAKAVGGESRWLVTGMIHDLVVTAIIPRRGDAIRLISLRRASHEERAHYNKVFERPT